MNSLERYRGVLNGRSVDILPRLPILMQWAAEYIGSNYGAFASDYRVLVEANLRCIADFGFDQVSSISDPYRETQGFGAVIEYVPDGVPRCPHPPLKQTRDFSSIVRRPDPLEGAGRMLDRVNAVRSFSEQAGGQYSILGWVEGPAAEAADLRGAENFLIDLVDNETYAGELMDLCIETGIDFARAQVEAGADTIGVGDAIASQAGPEIYERLIQPREKRLIRAIREMGALVRLHICGDTTSLLPGISDLDINIMDVDNMVDMLTVRKALGSGVALAGNIDPVAGVRFGTPDSIIETMCNTYREVGNPFMVTAGCEIPAGTPAENLKALCEPITYIP